MSHAYVNYINGRTLGFLLVQIVQISVAGFMMFKYYSPTFQVSIELIYTILVVSVLAIASFVILLVYGFYLYLIASGSSAKEGARIIIFFVLVTLGPSAYLGYVLIQKYNPYQKRQQKSALPPAPTAVHSVPVVVQEPIKFEPLSHPDEPLL